MWKICVTIIVFRFKPYSKIRAPFANRPNCTSLSVQKWCSHWSQMFSKCVLAWQPKISLEPITKSHKNHMAQWYAHLRTIWNLFEFKSSQNCNHFGSDACCNGKHDFSWIHSKIQTIITRPNGTGISDKFESILDPKVSQKCPPKMSPFGVIFFSFPRVRSWLTVGVAVSFCSGSVASSSELHNFRLSVQSFRRLSASGSNGTIIGEGRILRN